MATVRDMIRKKGGEIFAIAPDATVFDALRLMSEHNTGALLVMKDGHMAGIISERDCVRKLDLMGRGARETHVADIMTGEVVSIEADHDLAECMTLMIDNNIRHLPVYGSGELLGLISVRDVLKEMIEVQQMMLSELERYITGGGR